MFSRGRNTAEPRRVSSHARSNAADSEITVLLRCDARAALMSENERKKPAAAREREREYLRNLHAFRIATCVARLRARAPGRVSVAAN